MPTSKPKLSAIIACYRDAPAIPDMHARLTKTFKTLKVDYEIIFVNDNSPDNSHEVLEKLCKKDKRVVAIKHSRNYGSQSAFTSGLKICSGDAAILLDGDLQDPPEIIAKFYKYWRQGYEVIYGNRVKREATPFFQFAYKAFYRVFKHLSYIKIPVDAGDFSLLDRKVIDALNTLPESIRFMRGLRAWVGFKQIGVPYIRPERPYGTSTNSLIKNFWWARHAIVSFSYAPLELITYMAVGTVGLSALGITLQIILRLFFPDLAPKGVSTLIILILFLGGIQLLCLSIIGTYLSHIYEEVKRRPPFIVDTILNLPQKRRTS